MRKHRSPLQLIAVITFLGFSVGVTGCQTKPVLTAPIVEQPKKMPVDLKGKQVTVISMKGDTKSLQEFHRALVNNPKFKNLLEAGKILVFSQVGKIEYVFESSLLSVSIDEKRPPSFEDLYSLLVRQSSGAAKDQKGSSGEPLFIGTAFKQPISLTATVSELPCDIDSCAGQQAYRGDVAPPCQCSFDH